jgi:hypothetical protein
MASQQELPEPASLLDLTEDRLDRDLPLGVQTSPALGAQRATYAVRDREPRGASCPVGPTEPAKPVQEGESGCFG